MITPEDSAVSAPSSYARTYSGDISEPSAPADPDPNNPPWGVLQALLTWLGSVFLLFLPQLFAIPYLVTHYRGTRPTTETLLADKTFILIIVCGIIPAHVLTLVLAWAVATRLGKIPFRKVMGWSWKPEFGLWHSVGLALFLFMLAWLIAMTFGGQETDLDKILRSSRAAALVTAFVASATAPLVEEVIYRGILYPALQKFFAQALAIVLETISRAILDPNLQKFFAQALAVLVVTSLFAGLHVLQYWPNVAAISSIAMLSLVLTVVRARTGSLLPCYVIHLVFNGIQSLIIVFAPYLQMLYQLWRHNPRSGALQILLSFLG